MIEIGVLGLGTMGANLALNMADQGIGVGAWDLDEDSRSRFAEAQLDGPQVFATLETLVAALQTPRRIVLMIPAGEPVDSALESLIPLLDAGDVVIDGGNSHFADTERRSGALQDRGLDFVGMGVSGGSEGARHGPSLMPGGAPTAYEALEPILESIAAKTELGPCVSYLGPGGAGHFVKMVHNGIEYADMQAIAEAYDVMKRGLGLESQTLGRIFAEWNEGPLESFLIEITAKIFDVGDAVTGEALVEQIVDSAGQKGTGRWTAISAFERGVAAPSIAAAVDARVLSSQRGQRLEASRMLDGPGSEPPSLSPDAVASRVSTVRDALYASRICAFAQGLDLIRNASNEQKWRIPRAEVARIWMGGCIIRARLLGPIRDALAARPDIDNLLLDETIATEIEGSQGGWRQAVSEAAVIGVPTPVWSASLAYYDAYRTARLPQNLTQAQRDFFGAHTYRRLDDADGPPIHTDWASEAGR